MNAVIKRSSCTKRYKHKSGFRAGSGQTYSVRKWINTSHLKHHPARPSPVFSYSVLCAVSYGRPRWLIITLRRVAYSAVKSITACAPITATCLPLNIFISYANTDSMEPVIIHQELSPNGNCLCPAHSLFITRDGSGGERLQHKPRTQPASRRCLSLFLRGAE